MWDEGGRRGSNWIKRRGPRTLSAEEMDKIQAGKKKRFLLDYLQYQILRLIFQHCF